MSKLPERDIQTWLRLASKNLYVRRMQLDTKASVMVSVAAVLSTVMATKVYPSVQHDTVMTLGIGLLIVLNLLSMFLAVKAMHPKSRRQGRPSQEAIANGTAKLTAFEHFGDMSEAEYEAAIHTLLKDKRFVVHSITREVHELGQELAERYQLLSYSYSVFLFAMTLAVLYNFYLQYRMVT